MASRGRSRAVADPPAAVTDTHALVFHAAGGGKLGPHAAAFFDRCERANHSHAHGCDVGVQPPRGLRINLRQA